jgi:cyclic pyranopterin phosphate synthase
MGEPTHVHPNLQYPAPGKVITLVPAGSAASVKPASAASLSAIYATGAVTDPRQRRLHDLRISVTDKCNFRCTYCMPKDVFGPGYKFLPHDALLSFEEITRFAKISAELGVEKIRLTGGEPTLRRNLPALIEMLAQIKTPSRKSLDLTLTTNGSTLVKQAKALKNAGLQRITVSLDSMDDAVFRAMNDVDFPVSDVLKGIDAALAAGLAPVKVNMVVKRGVNEHTVVDMARHFKGTGVIVRFIEFMDVGSSNGWRMDDVVPSRDIVAAIHAAHPLVAAEAQYEGEVAGRWQYADAGHGGGEIGVISSVTQAFCSSCTRARLSTDGKIYTCLFAQQGIDFRTLLRDGTSSDEDIAALLAGLWQVRTDRYSEIRTAETAKLRKVEMSYIGG